MTQPTPHERPSSPASPPHAHGHSHSLASAGADVRTSPLLRYSTAALLVVVAVSTVLGLVWLWPDYSKVGEAAELASYQAVDAGYEQGEVLSVSECEAPATGDPGGSGAPGSEGLEEIHEVAGAQTACRVLSVGVRSGPDAGQLVELTVRGSLAGSGLSEGDRVELAAFPREAHPESEGTTAAQGYRLANDYEVGGIVRHLPLAILVLLFAGVVVAVGRLRGLFALVALGVAAFVLLGFVLPALIAGGPALLIGLVGSSAIMLVTLFFVHGPNLRTTSALIGTLAGILIISGVSWVSVRVTRLSGLGDESSGMLSGMVAEIDFRGLLTCSILIAGLGVLNDVTITQASSVWELRAAAPEMTRREIYRRAMRIGRDHIASTVYTVFFAYAGAAISTLIVLYLYNRPVLSLLTQEDIAIEIVRTMAGSIGLVLSVPITTAVAAMFVPPAAAEVLSPWREGLPTAGADPRP